MELGRSRWSLRRFECGASRTAGVPPFPVPIFGTQLQAERRFPSLYLVLARFHWSVSHSKRLVQFLRDSPVSLPSFYRVVHVGATANRFKEQKRVSGAAQLWNSSPACHWPLILFSDAEGRRRRRRRDAVRRRPTNRLHVGFVYFLFVLLFYRCLIFFAYITRWPLIT